MKNVGTLISKSMQNKNKVTPILDKEEGLADKIKRADDIMNNIGAQKKRKLIKNVTFALTQDDINVINDQIKRYMHLEGELLTKSLLIRTALNLFAQLNDNELKHAVKSINHVERGRPKSII